MKHEGKSGSSSKSRKLARKKYRSEQKCKKKCGNEEGSNEVRSIDVVHHGSSDSRRSGKLVKKKWRSKRNSKKRCPKGQNSNELTTIAVVHDDSHISTNWEKLSKIVGYDPCAKKSHVSTTVKLEDNVSGKRNHKHTSNQRKPVILVPAPSDQPAAISGDSKSQELANGFCQNGENGSEKADSSVLQSEGPVHEPKLLTRAIAMDCEMVGTGPSGKDSMLARISIVNSLGQCVYDKYVLPRIKVTDYRTSISGIRPKDVKNGEKFETIQKEVAEILKGRILVGHALKNDFKVLYFSHPRKWVRDTSKYKPFQQMCHTRLPSLKKLALGLLNTKIQTGEHNSVEDARTAMQIYSQYKKEWEVYERTKKSRSKDS